MSTVKGSALLTEPVKGSRVRECKDCATPNPATDTHTDRDYCPACVTNHLTRCRSCRVSFIRDGLHRLCLACRHQIGLFGEQA